MVYYIIDIGPKEFSEQVVVKETADQVGTHMLGRQINRYKIINQIVKIGY